MKTPQNTTTAEKIVAFHVGRGGHFNSPGFLSFLGEHEIGDYTDGLYLDYSNKEDFKNRFGYHSTFDKDQRCILDLIFSGDFDELEEKFGIKKEQLGDAEYFDSGNNPVGLTEFDVWKGIGTINIDNQYDTTYTTYLKDIVESEAQAILDYRGYVDADIVTYAKELLGVEKEVED